MGICLIEESFNLAVIVCDEHVKNSSVSIQVSVKKFSEFED